MLKTVRQEDLEKIKLMTIGEAVAYANQLARRLECDDCTEEEKHNGVKLLSRLTERVRFLKIELGPAFS